MIEQRLSLRDKGLRGNAVAHPVAVVAELDICNGEVSHGASSERAILVHFEEREGEITLLWLALAVSKRVQERSRPSAAACAWRVMQWPGRLSLAAASARRQPAEGHLMDSGCDMTDCICGTECGQDSTVFVAFVLLVLGLHQG